jgi:hypothetical protein
MSSAETVTGHPVHLEPRREREMSNPDYTSDGANELGEDGTIPNTKDGVAVGHSDKSSFEPEEDEQAPE